MKKQTQYKQFLEAKKKLETEVVAVTDDYILIRKDHWIEAQKAWNNQMMLRSHVYGKPN